MGLFVVLAAPWLVSVLLTTQLQRITGLFTPQWLTRSLAMTALVLAAAAWASIAAGIALAVADSRWSTMTIAVALACWLTYSSAGVALHLLRVVASVRFGRVFRSSSERLDDVLLVDDIVPDAFAVPGRDSVVVVTTALADALSSTELAAVLAHERAHLRAHDYVCIQAVELASFANPVLRPWRRTVRYAAERQADECAARFDRATAMRAVARASVLCSQLQSPSADLTRIGGPPNDAILRVRALQAAAPGRQRTHVLAAAALVVAALCANTYLLADVTQDRLAPEVGESPSCVVG